MTVCITTFSRDGYELYGHRMIESWLQFWPTDFKLIVYVEDFSLTERDDRLIPVDLNGSCPGLIKFKENSLEMLKNSLGKRETRRIQKTIKWSHKVFAIDHALKNIKDKFIIWLDGDSYSINPVSQNLPSMLIQDHLMAVHFEILKTKLHFETGLVVFNQHHSQKQLLSDILTSGYDNLDIYSMAKTWDGFWLAHLYDKFKLDVLDLSKNGRGVFGNINVRSILKHDVGSTKYRQAGYNEFTGRKI